MSGCTCVPEGSRGARWLLEESRCAEGGGVEGGHLLKARKGASYLR
jgi:hypothetical protein